MPGVPVSISSEVLPEMYEYERAITTVANSYVAPVVQGLRQQPGAGAEAAEDRRPTCTSCARTAGWPRWMPAANSPVNVLMSGPAGGVAGALWIAKQAGYGNLLTLRHGRHLD